MCIIKLKAIGIVGNRFLTNISISIITIVSGTPTKYQLHYNKFP